VLPESVALVPNTGNKLDTKNVISHWSVYSQEVPGSVLDLEAYYLD